tara:strand:- start:593 stop:1921 length:1329 start_codon:yes stop_codon:yes gene_type:complete
MPKIEPKTINDLIKILAYNDWAWDSNGVCTHPKDKPTVISLAEADYAWTERQANLAVILCKRYKTKFESKGFDIDETLKNKKFDQPFRIINSAKTIEIDVDKDEEQVIILRFPYIKKLVNLVRCLKQHKGLPSKYFVYDGESKTWTIRKTEVTTFYLVSIGIRYNFNFTSDQILDEYEEIKKEKLNFKTPCAKIIKDKIEIANGSEALNEYWKNNLENKKTLIQLDSCKNLGVNQRKIKAKAYTDLGKKIAHNSNSMLWIDKKLYSKDQIIAGLNELDSFPLIMPVSGDITDTPEAVLDMQNWIQCFKRHGFDEGKHFSFAFDFTEPKQYKDKDEEEKRFMCQSEKMSDEVFQIAYDLYQMSKSFKRVDEQTKVYFVRNKLSRSFMRSNLKFKCSITAIGGGFYHTEGEKVKRLLDNLPKKLYYSTYQPMSYQWKDRAINKL